MAIKITDPKIRVTMINDKVRMYLLPPLFNAAVRAGASIMRVYKNLDDYDISLKDDKTPITLADRVAHKTIREYLGHHTYPDPFGRGSEDALRGAPQLGALLAGRSAGRHGRIYQRQQRIHGQHRPDGE